MKIISLKVEGFARVKAVEIQPDGNIVRITGGNGQGKSSVLDAIWAALGGPKHVPEVPIHTGNKEALIEIDLGELLVTKIIKMRDGDADPQEMLVVKGKDGSKFANPQSALNKLMGALTFDPLDFVRATPEKRFTLLKTFVPDFDFEEADGRIKDAYNDRTDVNRELKKAEVHLGAVVVDEGAPTELIDEAALVAALENAGLHNMNLQEEERARATDGQRVAEMRDEARGMRDEAAGLRREAEAMEADAGRVDERAEALWVRVSGLEALAAPIDTTALREKIAEARQTNETISANIRLRRQRAELRQEVQDLEKKSGALTATIDGIKAEKTKAIAASSIPVEGLTLDEGAVLLNGLPFDRASTAQKITASVAIASALNPKLRVIQIREGSLLDTQARQLIADYAQKHDMQFWIEEVNETGEVGFHIEDGRVAAADLEAAE